MEKEAKERIIDLVYGIFERPYYIEKEVIDVEIKDDYLDVVLLGSFHHKIYFRDDRLDVATCDGCCGYSMEDLEYSAVILYKREPILDIARNYIEAERLSRISPSDHGTYKEFDYIDEKCDVADVLNYLNMDHKVDGWQYCEHKGLCVLVPAA